MHNSYIAHSFKQLYGQLSGLKTEIEHIQHLLEKSRVELQKDFEQWWEKQTTEGKVGMQAAILLVYQGRQPLLPFHCLSLVGS